MRPDVEPAVPETISPAWDAPAYDWLGDTYSSHVNSVFWKLHGWIDDRITQWATVNNVADITWTGNWLGKMPGHAAERSFARHLFANEPGAEAMRMDHDHGHGAHDLMEMEELVRIVNRSGVHCHFYDKVAFDN
jgi:hypothetical protein